MRLPDLLQVSEEVDEAIAGQRAVVALESTIISHGMPYPQNVETALRVESVVRENGAVPATIAVIEGRPVAGLDKDQIEMLGRTGQEAAKVSRRDLPIVVASGSTGATTVAATMIIANMAGIQVFATGGIGGVHRGFEDTMDVSADLRELARTPVAVVCAGIKSILDLPRTLEYLETSGVSVLGYQTDELPAFYSRSSGLKIDVRTESAKEIAMILAAKSELGLDGGMVIANPIPAEHAMEYESIEIAIREALVDMRRRSITGKATTPFLLQRIAEKTGGASLRANIELVLNNAELAAQIASELPGHP